MHLAFQTPGGLILLSHGWARTSPQLCSRPFRPANPRACLPSNNNEEKSDTQKRKPPKPPQWNFSHANKELLSEAESTFHELDKLAEQWIGADLSRWDWYERVKSRREKLLDETHKKDEEMEESYDSLRQTLMEFDALFGTQFLDGDTRVSRFGWTLVGLTMFLYILLGYAAVELVVKLVSEYASGTW